MSKYTPLHEHLETLSISVWRTDFDEIEKLIGANLPFSARSHPEWWANNTDGHTQSKAWVNAGWQIEMVEIAAQSVVFRKIQEPGFGKNSEQPDPYGWLKGTVTIPDGVDITKPMDVEWKAEKGIIHE